jgi:hypothetical protein
MNRSSASRSRRPIALIFGGLLALTSALPVAATMYSRETYEGTDAWAYDDCGPVVDATVSFSGNLTIRAGTGKDEGAFFAHDTFQYSEIHVRRSDGKVATVNGILTLKETRATRVEGSVFTFGSIYAGQIAMHDGDGNLVFRDRGTLTETILVDTLGNDVPGGEYLDTLASAMHGQYPGLTSGAFCDFWNS